MNSFNCSRCGNKYTTKRRLLDHINRSGICEPKVSDLSKEELLEQFKVVKPHNCDFCDKTFDYKTNKYRHQQSCKHKPTDKPEETKAVETNNISETGVANSGHINNLHNNSNNVTNNITNNIIINPLGKENMNYLTSGKNFDQYVIDCMRNKNNGIVSYFVEKHLNPEHPENNNISAGSKDKFLKYLDSNKKWKIVQRDEILDIVYTVIGSEFQSFIEKIMESTEEEKPQIKKLWLDNLMKSVGEALDWDLDNTEYTYEGDALTDKQKEKKKKEIFNLTSEYINEFEKSK